MRSNAMLLVLSTAAVVGVCNLEKSAELLEFL